jgi:hypothetical protein
MRSFLLRAALLGGLATATVGLAQPVGQPIPGRAPAPDVKKLKDELEALVKEREKAAKDAATPDPGSSAERVELRLKLLKMIDQIGQRTAPTPPPSPGPETLPKPKPVTDPKAVTPEVKPDPLEGSTPIDPLRAAQNLYKAGDVEAAYRALKMTKVEALSREDRVFAQYLTACCLRKTGKLSEAMVAYRELANANEDEFITECALWQLATIRSAQDFQGQLEQLRTKPKAK